MQKLLLSHIYLLIPLVIIKCTLKPYFIFLFFNCQKKRIFHSHLLIPLFQCQFSAFEIIRTIAQYKLVLPLCDCQLWLLVSTSFAIFFHLQNFNSRPAEKFQGTLYIIVLKMFILMHFIFICMNKNLITFLNGIYFFHFKNWLNEMNSKTFQLFAKSTVVPTLHLSTVFALYLVIRMEWEIKLFF